MPFQPDAILFDLDNTLILCDEPVFFKSYSAGLYEHLKMLMTPEEFSDRMNSATQLMVRNKGSHSNLDVFMEAFVHHIPLSAETALSRFMEYYNTSYPKLKSLMTPIPGIRALMELLQFEGYRMVIATNPLFPMMTQMMRLEWAGLAHMKFDLITGVENSHACKPAREYYQEILDKIKIPADRCLMVGNDPYNDMIAGNLGISTYLTTDSEHMSIELSRALAGDAGVTFPVPDYSGSILDLPGILGNNGSRSFS